MDRSRLSMLSSAFTAALFAGTLLLGGCSDSLTGTAPPDAEENVTVQQPPAQHNNQSMDDDGSADTDPGAGHNTSDED
jgi:hypothetical protein